jgi:DNA-binding PadR family transcriptional regulator
MSKIVSSIFGFFGSRQAILIPHPERIRKVPMKLTPRQQTFLDNLFDLYRELKGPVHYSIVADKLGVNKFSAYDMLKVLEEKGVAASSYVLSDNQAGPGRSQVVFYPTNKAAQFLTQLRDEVRQSGDWQSVKKRILGQLEDSRTRNPVDALRDALSSLPDAKAPLNYCAQMISIQLLNIERLRPQNLLPALENLSGKGQIALGTLSGLSIASALANDSDDTSMTEKLLAHTKRFQNQLTEMSDESISKLASFLSDAMAMLYPPQPSTHR